MDSNNNLYLVGQTEGNLDGNTNLGGNDLFLVKYDSAGTKQWTQQMGSSVDDAGHAITIDNFGDVYVAGTTYGSLDGNTNAGDADLFVAKYDSDRNRQWTRQVGTNFFDGHRVSQMMEQVISTLLERGWQSRRQFAGGEDTFIISTAQQG